MLLTTEPCQESDVQSLLLTGRRCCFINPLLGQGWWEGWVSCWPAAWVIQNQRIMEYPQVEGIVQSNSRVTEYPELDIDVLLCLAQSKPDE